MIEEVTTTTVTREASRGARDVLEDAARQEPGALQHYSNLVSHRPNIEPGKVLSIVEDAAGKWLLKTQ